MIADAVLPAALRLLESLGDRLEATEAGRPAVASLVPGGAAVAWDDCCEGKAWVRVVRIFPSVRFPEQVQGALNCHTASLACELEVGVLRCASTVDEQGEPPSAEQLTADAVRTVCDAEAMYQAIIADFSPGLGALALGQYLPTDVDGGCVGGTMTVTFPL